MFKKTDASNLEFLAGKLTWAHANLQKELKAHGAGAVVMIGGKPHKVVHILAPGVKEDYAIAAGFMCIETYDCERCKKEKAQPQMTMSDFVEMLRKNQAAFIA